MILKCKFLVNSLFLWVAEPADPQDPLLAHRLLFIFKSKCVRVSSASTQRNELLKMMHITHAKLRKIFKKSTLQGIWVA